MAWSSHEKKARCLHINFSIFQKKKKKKKKKCKKTEHPFVSHVFFTTPFKIPFCEMCAREALILRVLLFVTVRPMYGEVIAHFNL